MSKNLSTCLIPIFDAPSDYVLSKKKQNLDSVDEMMKCDRWNDDTEVWSVHVVCATLLFQEKQFELANVVLYRCVKINHAFIDILHTYMQDKRHR